MVFTGPTPDPAPPTKPDRQPTRSGTRRAWLALVPVGAAALAVLAAVTAPGPTPAPLDPPGQFETGIPEGKTLIIATSKEGVFTLASDGVKTAITDRPTAYALSDHDGGVVAVTRMSQILWIDSRGVETEVPFRSNEEFQRVIGTGVANGEPSVLYRSLSVPDANQLTLYGLRSGSRIVVPVGAGLPFHAWIGKAGIFVDFIQPDFSTFTRHFDHQLDDLPSACSSPSPGCPTRQLPSPDGSSRIAQYDHFRLVLEKGDQVREIIGNAFSGAEIELHDFDGLYVLLAVDGRYRIRDTVTGGLVSVIDPVSGDPIATSSSANFLY